MDLCIIIQICNTRYATLINLHIIGVQKAGTTALAHFLAQHPDVCLVDGKEAHVFDHPEFHLQANKARQARLKYRKKLNHYSNQKYICDATPITIFRPQYLEYCFNYNPDAKFIVILRDPVSRAVSHYNMSRTRGSEHRCMLHAFLFEPFRLKKYVRSQKWAFDSPARHQSYLSRGLYKAQLARVKKLVPKHNLLILQQEALLKQHSNTLAKVFEFLHLPTIPIAAKSHFQADKRYTHWSDGMAKWYAKCVFKLLN